MGRAAEQAAWLRSCRWNVIKSSRASVTVMDDIDMRIRLFALVAGCVIVALVVTIRPLAQRRALQSPQWPGVQRGGVTLLPNGWRIAPAGTSLYVGDFPLSMVATPDHRYLVISNNGWSKPTLTIVDTQQMFVKARVPVDHAWLGLAWDPGGRHLYSSGAAENTVNVFDYEAGELRPSRRLTIDRPAVQLPS